MLFNAALTTVRCLVLFLSLADEKSIAKAVRSVSVFFLINTKHSELKLKRKGNNNTPVGEHQLSIFCVTDSIYFKILLLTRFSINNYERGYTSGKKLKFQKSTIFMK